MSHLARAERLVNLYTELKTLFCLHTHFCINIHMCKQRVYMCKQRVYAHLHLLKNSKKKKNINILDLKKKAHALACIDLIVSTWLSSQTKKAYPLCSTFVWFPHKHVFDHVLRTVILTPTPQKKKKKKKEKNTCVVATPCQHGPNPTIF